jgi:cytochrome b involved in lipid metabolism
MAEPPLTFTRAQVAKHDTAGDLWLVIGRDVYAISKFLARHPGGPAPLRYAGCDATKVFDRVHKAGTLEKMGKKFIVGQLAAAEADAPADAPADADAASCYVC